MIRQRMIAAVMIFTASSLHAETWVPVTGADNLTALFSDTVQTAELGGGSQTVVNYNADGIGERKAWGDTFEPEHLIRLSISPVVSAPWNAGR